MQRYTVVLSSPDGRVPEADEFGAVIKAALAAVPEFHAIVATVIRQESEYNGEPSEWNDA